MKKYEENFYFIWISFAFQFSVGFKGGKVVELGVRNEGLFTNDVYGVWSDTQLYTTLCASPIDVTHHKWMHPHPEAVYDHKVLQIFNSS